MKTLAESELRYRRLFEAAQDGILILDAKTGMITDVNPFLINMLGYTREEFVEKKLWEVGAFKDIEASKDAFEALQKNEFIRYEDLPLKAKDGHLVQVEFVSNVYQAGDEKVVQCNIRDITQRKHAEDELIESEALMRELSFRDHLTGLYNRRYMDETLKRELHRAERKNLSLGIIMLDVDNLKRFNDNYGHAAGDAVLSQVGHMIRRYVRKEDIPARYGGDEFLIVLPDASLEVAVERAELICDYSIQFHHRFEGQTIDSISLSLGVAVYPVHGLTFKDLLKAADDALYQAKNSGRSQVVVTKSII
jgi:diguanylate cyclase (GGDEF)-like protein/PAS domain S-box-containing protein